MSRKVLFILFVLISTSIYADNISVKITVPKVVGVDESFTLVYEIGTSDISNFHIPDFVNFVLLDQSRSTSSSINIINGQSTTESKSIFKFYLKANKIGSFTIPPASFTYQNRIFKTRSIPIKVLQTSPNKNTHTNPPTKQHPYPIHPNKPKTNTTADNSLMIQATTSKTQVFEQEAILLTYKIYANTEVSGFNGKLPILDGFHIQEIEPTKEQHQEIIDGRPYATAIWKQYILYPQSSGTFTIPAIECEADIITTREDIGLWGIMPIRYSQKKIVKTKPITISVKKLPPPPDSFCGAVGNFSFSSTFNKKSAKVGDVISLKTYVRGIGNLRLFDQPNYSFPDGFETYDCKISESYDLTKEGHSGTKTFEYLAIPRKEGKYKMPPLSFTYFDTSTYSYKTLHTPSYDLAVYGNNIDNNNPLEIEELNKDIKHIKTNIITLISENNPTLFSWKYILAYILTILLYIISQLLSKHYLNISPNSIENKRKHTAKLVIKNMKKAKSLINNDNSSLFYDEMLSSLNTFVHNKLKIDKESLNKENIVKVLEMNNVDSETINAFLAIIEECESARFSSNSSSKSPSLLYNKAIDIISKIDNMLK